MERRTLWLLGLGFAIASIAAGCGDDDDSSDGGSGPAPLTKAEFITEADKVCSEANAQTQTEVSELLQGAAPTLENLPDVAELVASGIEDQADDIRGLAAPEGDEEKIDQIVEAADEGAEQVRDDPDSLSGSGIANESLAEANQLAVDYGLTVCGQDDG